MPIPIRSSFGPMIPFSYLAKNCSTFGTLDFSFMSFSLPFTDDIIANIGEPFSELGYVFQGGEIQVVAHGMGACIELQSNGTGNDILKGPLFHPLSLPAFSVCSILVAFLVVCRQLALRSLRVSQTDFRSRLKALAQQATPTRPRFIWIINLMGPCKNINQFSAERSYTNGQDSGFMDELKINVRVLC